MNVGRQMGLGMEMGYVREMADVLCQDTHC